MTRPTNENFQRLVAALTAMGEEASVDARADAAWQQFIETFPAQRLPTLSLDEYCLGKGDGQSFCWWLERGLQSLLGRYSPGTSKGHVLYFAKDGSVYKNRHLADLSDEAALRYTLAVQASIAGVADAEDWRWIDDNAAIYHRAHLSPRCAVADGRKLRLLAAYHPDRALPINSSGHVGHFLAALGCPAADIPPPSQPVARMLLLREYLEMAQVQVPGLTTVGFMRGLYRPELGLAPADDEDDEQTTDALRVGLSAGAIRNAYVTIPKGQQLFAAEFIAQDEHSRSAQLFRLELPDGSHIETCLLANRGRIKARFYELFKQLKPLAGDCMVVQKIAEGSYAMALERKDEPESNAQGTAQKVARRVAADLPSEPLNRILYGPPGTGKTYSTIEKALAILDPEWLDEQAEDRAALRQRFDELAEQERVRFVTFHQSFSYEDFVEGIRATTLEGAGGNPGALRYAVEPGLFGRLCDEARGHPNKPRVLIIDEINRGNISRIFGELITLIEPTKRAGAAEALEVLLPYSRRLFSVPANVYLIGTMNSADRSLTGMDVALRRRFVFTPMPPRPDLLGGIGIGGLRIEQLLTVINQRIEVLLDREHALGHAYFMALRDAAPDQGLRRLAEIFRCQILPLLQEYFFDDWQRIRWVLNDHRKPRALQFVQASDVSTAELFGSGVDVSRAPTTFALNEAAFDRIESYLGVIGPHGAAGAD